MTCHARDKMSCRVCCRFLSVTTAAGDDLVRRVTCPAQAEQCAECQACYVRSCASFECIPAVEVFLEDGITDEEVNIQRQAPHNCRCK